MSLAKIQVVWAPRARRSYKLAWRYVAKNSRKTADRIFDEIDDAVDALIDHPAKYPPDPYRKKNNGDFRAFEINQYRIAYQITESQINIVRLRHVKQKPLAY